MKRVVVHRKITAKTLSTARWPRAKSVAVWFEASVGFQQEVEKATPPDYLCRVCLQLSSLHQNYTAYESRRGAVTINIL